MLYSKHSKYSITQINPLPGIFTIGVGVISGKTEFSPFLLIPFRMVLFGWLLVSGGFWFEAKKAKALLNDIMLQRRQ